MLTVEDIYNSDELKRTIYVIDIKKAKPYTRVKRGKLERVKGYVGRVGKNEVSQYQKSRLEDLNLKLAGYKKTLDELKNWETNKVFDTQIAKYGKSYVAYIKKRIDQWTVKVKETEAKIDDLRGNVTTTDIEKPKPTPTVPTTSFPPRKDLTLGDLPLKFYTPTHEQINKFKDFVMRSDLEAIGYRGNRAMVDWLKQACDDANNLLFDGKLKNLNVGLLSTKSKRILGMYRPGWGNVQFNPRYFLSNTNKVALHETIVHELAHKAVHEIEKSSEHNPHGFAWIGWMRRLGHPNASRMNYHDIDIDTKAEKEIKKKTAEARGMQEHNRIQPWELHTKGYVKFFAKGKWVIGQLVMQMSDRKRWNVTVGGSQYWKVSDDHFYKLTPSEEEEAKRRFGSGAAFDSLTDVLRRKSQIRRQRRSWRRGMFNLTPKESLDEAAAIYTNTLKKFESVYGPDRSKWPGSDQNILKVKKILMEDAARKVKPSYNIKLLKAKSGK